MQRNPNSFSTTAALALLTAVAPCVNAQTNPGPYTPVNPRGTIPRGTYVIQPHPAEPVTSFEQLIRMAQLIAEATVISSLPTINRDPNSPVGVETDSTVSIGQVILGKAPGGGQIVLVEDGGAKGSSVISVAGDPLVKPGEQYILFLDPDPRTQVPNSVGILPSSVPRYYPVGYGNGKALITSGGTIQFAAGAISALHQYDNMGITSFISTLKSCVAALSPPAPPYPTGVAPLAPPKNSIFVPPGPKPLGGTTCGQ